MSDALNDRWQPAALVTSDIIILKLMLGAAAVMAVNVWLATLPSPVPVP